jgi:hypothetical protein
MDTRNPHIKARLIIALALIFGGIMFAWGTRVDAAIPAPPPINNPNGDKVCEPRDAHISGQNRKVITETIQDGLLITGWCVKAGSVANGYGPHYVTLDTPAKTVEITHPSGKQISHYVVLWIPEPVEPPPPVLADGHIAIASECDAGVLVSIGNSGDVPLYFDVRINNSIYDTVAAYPTDSLIIEVPHAGLSEGDVVFVYMSILDTAELLDSVEVTYAGDCEPPQELLAGIGIASECEAGVLIDIDNMGDVHFEYAIRINGEFFDVGFVDVGETLVMTVPHADLAADDMVRVDIYEPESTVSVLDAEVVYSGQCPVVPPPPPPVWECPDGTLVDSLDDCEPVVCQACDICMDCPDDEPPVTTVPETTVPETTVPETTVPETTVPETTVPETTVPETTPPTTEPPTTTAPEVTVVDTPPVIDDPTPTSTPEVTVADELPKTGLTAWLLMLGLALTATGLGAKFLARKRSR